MLITQLTDKICSSESEQASPRAKTDWSQHFTPAGICELVMKRIPVANPDLVIDLAVGKGELLWYARQEWLTCQIMGFDIDEKLVDHCKSRFGHHGTFECADTLRADLHEIRDMLASNSTSHTVDLALSNPPFGTTEAKHLDPRLLDTLSMHGLVWTDDTGGHRVHSETAFFVRNLELVRDGGYVAILLPEGVISGVKTESFRRFLLTHTQVYLVLSLPMNSFDSSEAKISLLVAQKSAVNLKRTVNIQLGTVNDKAESVQTVAVNHNELLLRMDPKYHHMMTRLKQVTNGYGPLGNYLDSCARGYGFYGADRKLLTTDGDFEYIHSIDIKDFIIRKSPHRLAVSKRLGNHHQGALIRQGDVLLVRVGRGCVGRCAIAAKLKSDAFASDCVYVLNSRRVDMYYLCLYLNTPFAKSYLDACSRGVCSQYITKADLIAMPLYLPEQEIIQRLSRDFRVLLDQIDSPDASEPQLSYASVLANQLDSLINDESRNYSHDST